MTRVFEANDIDTAHALLVEQYTSLQLSVGDERNGVRIEQDALGAARLDRIRIQMTADVTAEPLGTIGIGRVREGRVTYRQGRGEAVCVRGDVVFAGQPDMPYGAVFGDLDIEFAFLQPQLLSEVAATEPGTHGPVRLLDHRPASPAAAAQWSRTFSLVRAMVTSQSEHGPLVVGELARLLAAAALTTFPNNARADPTPLDRRDAHPDTVRRAVAYIESNADLDISVIDIARAAHVGPRALQLAFRRHLDTTPMRYLRRVRLELARADLRAAVPGDGNTVTSVAARWGYARPSRFAADYRAAYGEHPHRTLKDMLG